MNHLSHVLKPLLYYDAQFCLDCPKQKKKMISVQVTIPSRQNAPFEVISLHGPMSPVEFSSEIFLATFAYF